MNPDLAQRMQALLTSSGGLVFEQYLLALRDGLRAEFEQLPVEKFLEHKGRILQINSLLTHVQRTRNA